MRLPCESPKACNKPFAQQFLWNLVDLLLLLLGKRNGASWTLSRRLSIARRAILRRRKSPMPPFRTLAMGHTKNYQQQQPESWKSRFTSFSRYCDIWTSCSVSCGKKQHLTLKKKYKFYCLVYFQPNCKLRLRDFLSKLGKRGCRNENHAL